MDRDRFDGITRGIGRRGLLAGIAAAMLGTGRAGAKKGKKKGASPGLCRKTVRWECATSYPSNVTTRNLCLKNLLPCCVKAKKSVKKAVSCLETGRRIRCIDLVMRACGGHPFGSPQYELCWDIYAPCCKARGTLVDKLACNGWINKP